VVVGELTVQKKVQGVSMEKKINDQAPNSGLCLLIDVVKGGEKLLDTMNLRKINSTPEGKHLEKLECRVTRGGRWTSVICNQKRGVKKNEP